LQRLAGAKVQQGCKRFFLGGAASDAAPSSCATESLHPRHCLGGAGNHIEEVGLLPLFVRRS
jgi:hypothetical protein